MPTPDIIKVFRAKFTESTGQYFMAGTDSRHVESFLLEILKVREAEIVAGIEGMKEGYLNENDYYLNREKRDIRNQVLSEIADKITKGEI